LEKAQAGYQIVTAFSVPGHKKARYYFIQSSLKQFHYRVLTKRQKGIVIRFLLQVTGYSRQRHYFQTHFVLEKAQAGYQIVTNTEYNTPP
jgi:hypothetical protein